MILPILYNRTSLTFGILKEYRKNGDMHYMRGIYKDYNVEIYNTLTRKEKLVYVSDKALNLVKLKLSYMHNNIKRILKMKGNN